MKNWKIMCSKFPGVCTGCKASVGKGENIVYRGRGAGILCYKCGGLATVSWTREREGCRFDMDVEDRMAEQCGPGL